MAEAVISTLAPIQQEYKRIMDDKAYLETIWRSGAERASRLAERTLSKFQKKIGLVVR